LIARGTPGFSGADLANLVNEAALYAARQDKRTVSMEEFEQAKDKIMMGAERKSMVMSEKEKRNTAYHESGHCIVSCLVPEHDPTYKVTIIPRGRALGVTMFLPEEDRYSMNRRMILSQICSLFGGRIAEELTLGRDGITTGASNDIERATKMARAMVAKWGLSDKLGPLMYDEESEGSYMGMSQGPTFSGETAKLIDQEVRSIVDECYARATKILVDNRDKLDMMTEALMEYETIDRGQIDEIMRGQKPSPPKDWDGPRNTPTPGADSGTETTISKVDVDPSARPGDVLGGTAGEH
jgi:cell division protease FtsH